MLPNRAKHHWKFDVLSFCAENNASKMQTNKTSSLVITSFNFSTSYKSINIITIMFQSSQNQLLRGASIFRCPQKRPFMRSVKTVLWRKIL